MKMSLFLPSLFNDRITKYRITCSKFISQTIFLVSYIVVTKKSNIRWLFFDRNYLHKLPFVQVAFKVFPFSLDILKFIVIQLYILILIKICYISLSICHVYKSCFALSGSFNPKDLCVQFGNILGHYCFKFSIASIFSFQNSFFKKKCFLFFNYS